MGNNKMLDTIDGERLIVGGSVLYAADSLKMVGAEWFILLTSILSAKSVSIAGKCGQ